MKTVIAFGLLLAASTSAFATGFARPQVPAHVQGVIVLNCHSIIASRYGGYTSILTNAGGMMILQTTNRMGRLVSDMGVAPNNAHQPRLANYSVKMAYADPSMRTQLTVTNTHTVDGFYSLLTDPAVEHGATQGMSCVSISSN